MGHIELSPMPSLQFSCCLVTEQEEEQFKHSLQFSCILFQSMCLIMPMPQCQLACFIALACEHYTLSLNIGMWN